MIDPFLFGEATLGAGALATLLSVYGSVGSGARRRLARLVPCSGYSVKGARHLWNEDHYVCLDGGPGAEATVAVIADGVSQGAAGALAAKLVADTVAWSLYGLAEKLPEDYGELRDKKGVLATLQQSVVSVDNMFKRHYSQFMGPHFFAATTVTAALVFPGRYYCFVHVGNTRLYEVSGEKLRQVTRDQERGGMLSSAVAAIPQIRPVPDADCRPLKSGVTHLLLISDGLAKVVGNEKRASKIARIIGDSYAPPLAARAVVEYALSKASLNDDATAVVVLAE